MATLKLEIVTPEEKIYSEDVEMVTLPGAEGELGVYPKHVPVLTTLKPGELRVIKDGRETAKAVASAQAAMKEDHTAEEIAGIQASLQKALAQMHVKRRRQR